MENDPHMMRSGDTSTAGVVAIVIIAAVLIIGFLMFMMQVFPFNQVGSETDIDVGTPEEDLWIPDVEQRATPME